MFVNAVQKMKLEWITKEHALTSFHPIFGSRTIYWRRTKTPKKTVFNYFFISSRTLPENGKFSSSSIPFRVWCRSHNRIIIWYLLRDADEKCVHKLVINNLLYSIAFASQLCVVIYGDHFPISNRNEHRALSDGLCNDENQLRATIVSTARKVQGGKKFPVSYKNMKISFTFFCCWCSARCWAELREGFCFSFCLSSNAVHVQSLIYANRREEKNVCWSRERDDKRDSV